MHAARHYSKQARPVHPCMPLAFQCCYFTWPCQVCWDSSTVSQQAQVAAGHHLRRPQRINQGGSKTLFHAHMSVCVCIRPKWRRHQRAGCGAPDPKNPSSHKSSPTPLSPRTSCSAADLYPSVSWVQSITHATLPKRTHTEHISFETTRTQNHSGLLIARNTHAHS